MTTPKRRTELTAAEIDIVRLVSRGYTNEAIAGLLGLKVETLRSRIDNIHAVIGTSAAANGVHGAAGISRVRMVIWAYENGIATQKVTEHTDDPDDVPDKQVRNSQIEHGSYKGWQRHHRAGETACDLCEAARRGYTVGYRYGLKGGGTISAASRLAERAFEVCRQLVYKRPYPVVREAAVAIVREVDAEATIEAYEKAQAA